MSNTDRSLEEPEATAPASQDVVLVYLRRAAREYVQAQTRWQQQAAELAQAREQIEHAEEIATRLRRESATARAQAQEAREQARREHERTEHLEAAVTGLYASLFKGNIYELILKTSLIIVSATRGLYLTTGGKGDSLRIRAAIAVDVPTQSVPTPFIRALCEKVLRDGAAFVVNGDADLATLPRPDRVAEQFRNCIVAPVMLLDNLNGIVIAADKLSGDFDEHDAGVLLSIGKHTAAAVQNVRLHRWVERTYLTATAMLADAVEAKDPYRQGQSELVSRYARQTAARLGLPDHDQSIVYLAALLHDIGKVAVSDGVLNKPGPLLVEERDLVRSHVRVGYDLISRVPGLEAVAQAVLHHHEWYDGTGYPDGLAGDAIPIAARIVGAADAYCAMISKRGYRDACTAAQARVELQRGAGTQFDPRVIETLLAVLDDPVAGDPAGDEAGDFMPLLPLQP